MTAVTKLLHMTVLACRLYFYVGQLLNKFNTTTYALVYPFVISPQVNFFHSKYGAIIIVDK